MMWFAQQHDKPMMIAESGVQRMSSTLNANGTQNDSDYAAFMTRLSALLNYVGPLPNGTISGRQTNFIGTGYNLSGVVKMVTYIDIDWRYGFDGQTSPTQGFGESSTSGWFVNSLLSDYPQGSAAFCSVLSNDDFTTRCTKN